MENISIYLKSLASVDGMLVSNNLLRVEYPGKHANVFNLQAVLDSIGLSSASIFQLGGIVGIRTVYTCHQYPFGNLNCGHQTTLKALEYYGESPGYYWEVSINFPESSQH